MFRNILKSKKLVFLGCLIGVFTFFVPVLFLLALLFFSIFLFLCKKEKNERETLVRILVIAMILRFALFVFSLFFMNTFIFMDYPLNPFFEKSLGHINRIYRDFQRETESGVRLARFFRGEMGDVDIKEASVHGTGSYLHLGAYFQAYLNVLFGASGLNWLVFPVIGLWMIILVYYLAKDLFSRRVAVISGFLVALLPSFAIWSCINIRTTLSIIAVLILGFSFSLFSKRNHPKYLFGMAIGIFLFHLAKAEVSKLAIMITPVVLLLALRVNKKIKITLVMISAFAVLVLSGRPSIKEKLRERIISAVYNQVYYATDPAGGSSYKIYDEDIYSGKIDLYKMPLSIPFLIKGMIKGTIYFLFAPFPWEMHNILRLYSYPQIILWYFLFPFSLLGMLIGLRYKTAQVFSILLFTFFTIPVLSMAMGNEGIVARHRDLFAPFFCIFAVAGFLHFFNLEGQEANQNL